MAALPNTLAVIPGRFQLPRLHPGHLALFAQALEECGEVLVVSGVPYQTSANDPYDFVLQKLFLEETFAGKPIRVVENSTPTDASPELRSQMLDAVIECERGDKDVIIYGSSDSIVHKYTGRFATRETPTITATRGTDIRKAIAAKASEEFREGVAYAARERKTIPFPAVDVVPVSGNLGDALLISKPEDDGKLRFAGVFYDPSVDDSFEDAAIRCIKKELRGMSIGSPVPVGSHKVVDPRFKRTQDGVVTTLMRVNYSGEVPQTEVGVKAVRVPMWFRREDIPNLIDMHRPLAELIMHRWSGC